MDLDFDLDECVKQAQSGDPASFGQLVRVHQRVVFAFLMGWVRDVAIADDLTQSTFIRAWKAIGQYRGQCAFQTWLLQIALNNARSWGRWRSVRTRREISLSGPTEESGSLDSIPDRRSGDPAKTQEDIERRERLQSLVDRLPAKEKAVFLLRHENQLPLKEIGQALGIAEGSVKAHLSHGLTKIRIWLKDSHDL